MKKKLFSIIKNERGSGLVVALLILAAVTIIGISALNTSNVEVLLSNNDLIYKRNVYRSESATMEGAQEVEDEDPDNMIPSLSPSGETIYNLNWLNAMRTNMRNPTLWTETSCVAATVDDTMVAVVNNNVARGGSLDMTSDSQIRKFSVFGFCNPGNGSTFVEIGYKRRFSIK